MVMTFLTQNTDSVKKVIVKIEICAGACNLRICRVMDSIQTCLFIVKGTDILIQNNSNKNTSALVKG